MERHIIISHELPVLHIVRVFPPLLPVFRVLRCDANITDGRVEPHVENLVLEALQRHLGAPHQVPGDAPGLETPLDPSRCCNPRVVAPPLSALLEPFLEALLDLEKLQEEMIAAPHLEGAGAELAPGIHELHSVDQLPALVTLVTPGVLVPEHSG